MTIETWRPVVGHEGSYEVSDQGRVRSLDRVLVDAIGRRRRVRGKVLSPAASGQDRTHLGVVVDGKTRRIHTLVAAAFLGPCPPGKEVVCHNNGDGFDNRASNLRWGTHSANAIDQVLHGVHNNASKTHCKNGHPFDEENTAYYPGRRDCRTCTRGRHRARRQREAAAS